MSNLSNTELKKFIHDCQIDGNHRLANTLSELLSLREAQREPVAVVLVEEDTSEQHRVAWTVKGQNLTDGRQELYAAPQLPAVPDTRGITPHFDTIALDTAREIMCDVNRRHEFIGGDIQLLSRIQCRIDDTCRAAIAAAPKPEPAVKK